ncbi:hypothetical protein L1987_86271 [Smallanthus sonchifolius]|uniref:Uncharacterized protein n=1 Tax=Smallanthus sonchifolius TaxID=185202 RepID=A0ACB8XY55_9ASTR|nr:hypothetical protein L1987_86271 [Smallanthus sonchifolius]
MVLFEVLCGRLCTVKEDDGLFLSAKLVIEYYQKSKLDEIVHPILRKQISASSMYRFSAIAYRCLQDDREQRPPMDVVIKELEEMLKIELSQSGYLAIEEAPSEKQPVVIRPIALQMVKFKKVNAVPTDKQPVVVQSVGVPSLPLGELKEITDNFGIKSQIGEGLYGKVYVGVLRSGQAAAIKILYSMEQLDQEFLDQVSMFSRLKHDNVVQMLGFCVDGRRRLLAYEYAPKGSLRDILHGKFSSFLPSY